MNILKARYVFPVAGPPIADGLVTIEAGRVVRCDAGRMCAGGESHDLGNAAIIRATLADLGFSITGGDNSPYLWINVGKDSWKFFDKLLKRAQVVTTPGAGFGRCGQGFIRISAFNSRENVEEAMKRLRKVLK